MIPPIATYYDKLFAALGGVRDTTLAHQSELAKVHMAVDDLVTWSKALEGRPEVFILDHAAREVQYAALSLVMGLYRPAFWSLRLSLELSLASVYYSAHQLELAEWASGAGDLRWGTITDPDNGVFSHRFARAFFPDLREDALMVLTESKAVYRELSEYVHGNAHTWTSAFESVAYDGALFEDWCRKCLRVAKVTQFALGMRFLRELTPEQMTRVEHTVLECLGHYTPISDLYSRSAHS